MRSFFFMKRFNIKDARESFAVQGPAKKALKLASTEQGLTWG